MLLELTIRDFALIEQLTITLNAGFSVLTGETGAGKSIVIDALGLALGERADSTQVRAGSESAVVEAAFHVAGLDRVQAALADAGLAAEEDGSLILGREVWLNGRSRCRVNGRVAPLSAVRAVSAHLVDIHGQHEHQALIREETHLEFLDNFAGPGHRALRGAFADKYRSVLELRAQLEALAASDRERAQRLDLLQFQSAELSKADLQPGEDEALSAERRRLIHAEKLRAGALVALQALQSEAESVGALDLLGVAQGALQELQSLDDQVIEICKLLDQAYYHLEEAAGQLSSYHEDVESDPARLEELEQRLELISQLKRKYGDTVEQVLEVQDALAAELASIETSGERRRELQEALAAAEREATEAGEKLSAARKRAAKKLAAAVEREARPLGMPKATFRVDLSRRPDGSGLPVEGGERVAATDRGLDQARFELSANPGQPLKSLSRVASGGELSRLMLAFKSLCSRASEIPTMIFDEIDAGIGGRTAHAVGRRLAKLAAGPQVLCVTHLPQIARLCDHHLRVSKKSSKKRTFVEVTPLEAADRVAEIARLLGASEQDELAHQHATEMLETAEEERTSLRADQQTAG